MGTSERSAAGDAVEWRHHGVTGINVAITGMNAGGFCAGEQLRDDAGGKLELHHQRDVYAVGLRCPNGDADGDRQRGHAEQQPDGNGYGHHSADHADHGSGEQATVSGNVTVTATASDNMGVSVHPDLHRRTRKWHRGTSSPLNYSWNTAAVSNGSHTICSVASDAAGNTGNSAVITVTVNNTRAAVAAEPRV